MDNEQPVLPPAVATKLIAELRDPATRIIMEVAADTVLAMSRNMQQTVHATLDIPRAEFDRMMAEDGPAMLDYLSRSARIHKMYAEILDRLINAMKLRNEAPKHM